MLLKKIVVKNVGVVKAFNTPNASQLEPLTSFYARNGRGKTTLSSILRSASMNDPDSINGRRTFGQGNADSEVTLIFENGNVRFKNGGWQKPIGWMDVFDGDFIASNLYAGESVELTHDRGLFTVVLGRAGVKLVKQLEFFVGVAKRIAQKLKDAESALSNDIPGDLSREEFFALIPGPDIDVRIEQAAKDLAGIIQADRLTKLQKLQVLAIPTLEPNIPEILARTVAQIEESARQHLAKHFVKFGLIKRGEAWVKYGLEHIQSDACPFCGKDQVNETGLVTVYTQIFGEAYKTHFDGIGETVAKIDQYLGPDARVTLSAVATKNADTVVGWTEFYALGGAELPKLDSALENIETAYLGLKALFDLKGQSPLVVIQNGEAVGLATESLNRAFHALTEYNEAINGLNALFQEKKIDLTLTEAEARERLSNMQKRKSRTDAGVLNRIDAALSTKLRDIKAKRIRVTAQPACS